MRRNEDLNLKEKEFNQRKMFDLNMEICKRMDFSYALLELIGEKTRKSNTNVVGHFHCKPCKRSWRSGKIAITISFYPNSSSFNVKIYKQMCAKCKLSIIPKFDKEEYIERVSSKLELMSNQREPSRTTNPHIAESCEACIAGVQHIDPPVRTPKKPAVPYYTTPEAPIAPAATKESDDVSGYCVIS